MSGAFVWYLPFDEAVRRAGVAPYGCFGETVLFPCESVRGNPSVPGVFTPEEYLLCQVAEHTGSL